MAGHLIMRETSRFFPWNLSFLVKPLVFRRNLSFLAKLLGFPKNPSVFSWLMAGHLMRRETSRLSRKTFRFSWNLSSFAETFRFSRSFLVFPKTPRFSPLINGRSSFAYKLPWHSWKKTNVFLEREKVWPNFPTKKEREKPKNSREEPREKKRKSSLQISVPDPVTSSVEIRTGIKALRLVRPHAPQVVRLARKTLGQECSRDPIITCRKIIHQSKYWNSFSIIVK